MFTFNINCRLLKDPECKNPTQEKPIVELFVADTDGKKDEKTGFRNGTSVSITVFGQSAEFALLNLHKGDQIAITGSITEEKWTDKTTGAEKKKMAFRADRISKFWPPKNQDLVGNYDDEHSPI